LAPRRLVNSEMSRSTMALHGKRSPFPPFPILYFSCQRFPSSFSPFFLEGPRPPFDEELKDFSISFPIILRFFFFLLLSPRRVQVASPFPLSRKAFLSPSPPPLLQAIRDVQDFFFALRVHLVSFLSPLLPSPTFFSQQFLSSSF